MFTVFKSQIMQLIGTIWFAKQRCTTETEKNVHLKQFVKNLTSQIQSMNEQKLQAIRQSLKDVRRGINLIEQNPKNDEDDIDIYKNLQKFVWEFTSYQKVEFEDGKF